MRIIAGQYKGKKLKSLPHAQLKPIDDRVKEALFNILAPHIEGKTVCDLFAGSGAIGFEALSRGAKSVCFVEKEPSFHKLLRQNIDGVGVEDQTEIWPIDVFDAISRCHQQKREFDFVFIDPPYFDRAKMGGGGKVIQIPGIRKPKPTDELAQKEQAGAPLPDLILNYLDNYPILAPLGIGVIRTFKKIPVQFEPLKTLRLTRQERYGDALLSFFSLK